MLPDKECDVCGDVFSPVKANAVFCSAECRDNPQYKYMKYRERQDKGSKVCRKCKKTFVGPNYFFCSPCHYQVSKQVDHV